MKAYYAVDFGTSNSAVAVFSSKGSELIRLSSVDQKSEYMFGIG